MFEGSDSPDGPELLSPASPVVDPRLRGCYGYTAPGALWRLSQRGGDGLAEFDALEDRGISGAAEHVFEDCLRDLLAEGGWGSEQQR